jgi:hypothetical protein
LIDEVSKGNGNDKSEFGGKEEAARTGEVETTEEFGMVEEPLLGKGLAIRRARRANEKRTQGMNQKNQRTILRDREA